MGARDGQRGFCLFACLLFVRCAWDGGRGPVSGEGAGMREVGAGSGQGVDLVWGVNGIFVLESWVEGKCRVGGCARGEVLGGFGV